jgi:hypothetical protein
MMKRRKNGAGHACQAVVKGAVCLADGVRRPGAPWDGADHRLGLPGSAPRRRQGT